VSDQEKVFSSGFRNEGHSLFRILTETAPVAIFIYSKTKFLYANPASEEITGYSVKEMLSFNFWDIVHPDDQEMIRQRGLARLRGEEVNPRYTFRIITKSDTTKWIDFSSRAISYRGETAALGTAYDITARYRAFEILQTSEERYRRFFENVPVGIFRSNDEGHFTALNPAGRKILGIGKDEPLKDIEIYNLFYHPEDQHRFINLLDAKGIIHNFEYQVTRRDGKVIWLSEDTRAIRDSSGKVIEYEGAFTEITEAKKVKEELIKAREKAEESDRLKSAFLATMSHELRTPLNAIIGFSEIICEENDLDNIHQFSHIVLNQGTHLLSIIESILEVSLLDTKNATVCPVTIHLPKFFQELKLVAENQAGAMHQDHLQLVYKPDVSSKMNKIKADPVKIRQVMINLINNALKFTEEGYVKFGYIIENSKDILLFVEDSGPGIPKQHIQTIFEQFRQLDDSPTRKHGGIGLGLTVCKKIAHLLGGELYVTSEPGKGSRFSLRLPGVVINEK